MKRIVVPTLCFHSVRNNLDGDSFAVTPEKFTEIMKFVSEKFGTWDMNELHLLIAEKKFISENKVLITFDDGYKDNYDIALPILRRFGVKAVFFLLPPFFGKNNLWNPRSEVIIDHLSVDEARLIANEGHTIGSHGMTHQRLTKFSDSIIESALRESKSQLESLFGSTVSCYAYPYGATDSRVNKIAKKIYTYSFGVDNTPEDWNELDLSQIRREFVWPTNTTKQIEKLVTNFGSYDNNPNNILISS